MAPSRPQSLLLNSSALVAATLVARVLAVPVMALMVRLLSEQALGEYLYLTALVGLFAPLVSLGLPVYIAREVVQQPERSALLLKAAYRLQVLAGLLAFGLLAAFGQGSWLLLVCAVGMVAGATSQVLQYALIGSSRATIASAVQVGTSLLSSASLLAVLCAQPRLEAVVWQFAAAGLLQHGLAYLVVRRYYPEWLSGGSIEPARADYLEVLRGALPNLLLVLTATLYFRIDTTLLAAWSSLVEVARYGAAYKFVELAASVMTMVGWALFAEFSRLYAEGGTRIGDVARRSLRYLVLISLPMAAVLAFFARDVLQLFYGSRYLQSTPILQILAWTALFLFARELLGSLLQAHNRVKVQVLVYGLSLALNVALNYLTIPTWGGTGAAVATLACELFNCIAFSYVCRHFGIFLINRWIISAFAASVAMLATFYFSAALPTLAAVLLGLVAYSCVYWATGGLLLEDWMLLRRLSGLDFKRLPGF